MRIIAIIASHRNILPVAALLLATTSFQAQAQKPRLANVVRGMGTGAEADAGFVAHFIHAMNAEDDRYQQVNLLTALGSASLEIVKQDFRVADEMLEKGRADFESLELDAAVEHISTALSKYERHAGHVDDFSKLASGLMLLGAVHILRGEEETGKKRLSQAVAIMPGIEPDPTIFNPGMREVFQQSAIEFGQRPTGSLKLTSTPSYARVYINGAFVGVTPGKFDQIREGRHFVRLVRDGYRSWGKVLDVKAGGVTDEVATLKPTDNFADFDSLGEEAVARLSSGDASKTGDAMDQLGVLLNNLDFVFLTEVTVDGSSVAVRSALYDLNRQERIAQGKQTFSHDSRPEIYEREIRELVNREFSREALSPATGGPTGVRGDAPVGLCAGMECSTFRWTVGGISVGTGAVLMGVGGIMWALAKRDNDAFVGTPQLASNYVALRDGGRSKSIMGDTLFFLGAGVLVTGTLIAILWQPSSPELSEVAASGGVDFGIAPGRGGGMATMRVRWP